MPRTRRTSAGYKVGVVDTGFSSDGRGRSPWMSPDSLIPPWAGYLCMFAGLEPAVSHILLESPLPPHLSSQKALNNNCP